LTMRTTSQITAQHSGLMIPFFDGVVKSLPYSITAIFQDLDKLNAYLQP
jgi:hypothetical protein